MVNHTILYWKQTCLQRHSCQDTNILFICTHGVQEAYNHQQCHNFQHPMSGLLLDGTTEHHCIESAAHTWKCSPNSCIRQDSVPYSQMETLFNKIDKLGSNSNLATAFPHTGKSTLTLNPSENIHLSV